METETQPGMLRRFLEKPGKNGPYCFVSSEVVSCVTTVLLLWYTYFWFPTENQVDQGMSCL